MIIGENILLDHDRGLAIGFLESSVFGNYISKVYSGTQEVESGMPRNLPLRGSIARAAIKPEQLLARAAIKV